MRITGYQAKRMALDGGPDSGVFDALDALCIGILAAAKEGSRSVKVLQANLDESQIAWLETNGYDVFRNGDTTLVSWEFAHL